MSDNLAFMQGSGALIASDDIDGVQLLRVKVQTGADGAAADVSADNPMPVSLVTAISGVDLAGPLPPGTNRIGDVGIAVMPPLPGGTNSIGSVTINAMPNVTIGAALPAGVNRIGSVDIASLPPLPAGTNGIGSVAVTSLPTVTVGAALPAGSNKVGSVDVASLPPLPAGSNGIGSVVVSSMPAVTIGAGLPAGLNKVGSVDVASLPALPAGSNAIGSVSVSSLPNVTIGSALPAGTNTLGAVNLKPTTAGGLSVKRVLGLSNSAVSVKSSAGQVFGWHLSNTGTAGNAFVKLYNVSPARIGTDPAFLTLFVASGQSIAVEFANGIAFGTAIYVAATTNYQDTDTTAPSGIVIANVLYA